MKRSAAIRTWCRLTAFLACVTATPAFASDPADVAARIDAVMATRWEAAGLSPAAECDPATYFRRVNLDLVGRIPTAAETRDFLDDPAPFEAKRRRIVGELLGRPTHVVHFTNLWRNVLLPEASGDLQSRQFVPEFEDWLRRRLLAGRGYDELVREILTVPRVETGTETGPARPSAFYDVKDGEPEKLAAATSRAFLGVRLECAQCHDHPFDDWSQDQFWQLAAFFAAPGFADEPQEITVHDTDRKVAALFPDGTSPGNADPRRELAEWVTSAENPYFARSVANRVWAQMMGRGLVEPVDDFSPANEPTHPELLDLLAEELIAGGFDVRALAEAVVLSKPYRLSSVSPDPAHADPTDLTRMPLRALSPEQLYDSLTQATGRLRVFDPSQPVNFNGDEARTRFLEQFAREAAPATDQPSGILQTLMVMNGQFVSDATDLAESRTLAAVADAPFLSHSDRVEAVFLAALTRVPRSDESHQFTQFVEQADDPRAALADVFWVLLNSSEFLFQH